MDQEIVIELEIEDPKLISINEQYIHPVRKAKSGRYFSYFAKSPRLVEVQEYYKEVLEQKISDEDITRLKEFVGDDKNRGLSLTIELGLPLSSMRENDISNFIKAIEDCVVSRTGIDDSRDYEVIARKCCYESEDKKLIAKIILKSYCLQAYERVITDDDQIKIDIN